MSAIAVDQRLDVERRQRPRFAIVAACAGVLLIAASVVQGVAPQPKVSEQTLALIAADKGRTLDLVAAVLQALASFGLAATLVFLIDAAKARNPQIAPFVRILAIVGGALAGIAGLAYTIVVAQKAHQFVTSGNQTYQEAHHLTATGAVVVLQLLGLLGALLVAMSFVLVSLQAMRVGLLTRFMGYLGLIAGALVIFQITPVPIVEAYWLLALSVLFVGRWPNQEPAAWSTGRAERWPSSQEMREQRIRAAGNGGRSGRPQRGASPRGQKAAKPAAIEPAPPSQAASGRSAAKRKRKRRR
jgi:hypothetical protein